MVKIFTAKLKKRTTSAKLEKIREMNQTSKCKYLQLISTIPNFDGGWGRNSAILMGGGVDSINLFTYENIRKSIYFYFLHGKI